MGEEFFQAMELYPNYRIPWENRLAKESCCVNVTWETVLIIIGESQWQEKFKIWLKWETRGEENQDNYIRHVPKSGHLKSVISDWFGRRKKRIKGSMKVWCLIIPKAAPGGWLTSQSCSSSGGCSRLSDTRVRWEHGRLYDAHLSFKQSHSRFAPCIST